jgi:hypothetical protein
MIKTMPKPSSVEIDHGNGRFFAHKCKTPECLSIVSGEYCAVCEEKQAEEFREFREEAFHAASMLGMALAFAGLFALLILFATWLHDRALMGSAL